ncbi:hypothetical protein [Faecalicatena faecalis]|nr:hypothetical protein [Faecalicatena faecalis]
MSQDIRRKTMPTGSTPIGIVFLRYKTKRLHPARWMSKARF